MRGNAKIRVALCVVVYCMLAPIENSKILPVVNGCLRLLPPFLLPLLLLSPEDLILQRRVRIDYVTIKGYTVKYDYTPY